MLTESDTRIFTARNDHQATKIVSALGRHHQKSFRNPALQICRLDKRNACKLLAGNPHARNLWMKALGSPFAAELGLKAPDFRLRRPLYLVTLTDDAFVRAPSYFDYEDEEVQTAAHLSFFKRKYHNYMCGVPNYVALMEPAMFVYRGPWLYGSSPLYHYHVHALAWGCSQRRLKAALAKETFQYSAFLPQGKAVTVRRVKQADFLQMLWYITKSPRNQMQFDGKRLFKGEINGVNAVRQYSELRSVSLLDLTFANGRGKTVLVRALDELRPRPTPRRPRSLGRSVEYDDQAAVVAAFMRRHWRQE